MCKRNHAKLCLMLVSLTIILSYGSRTALSLTVPSCNYNRWRHPCGIATTNKSGKTAKATVTSSLQLPRKQCISSIVLESGDYEEDKKEENDDNAYFDFSSTIGWENYYKKNPDSRLEWHDSIDVESLIDKYIASDLSSKCLMVGCGNSKLPQVLLRNSDKTLCDITLLDTSQTCLDQLKDDIHKIDADSLASPPFTRRMSYVCGDATKLSEYFKPSDHFDIIIDKGLTDAIICGEGWNTQIELLFMEASKVLQPNSGRYLLISYNLSESTKEFFREIGDEVGLSWQFQIKDSNEKVMVSLASKA